MPETEPIPLVYKASALPLGYGSFLPSPRSTLSLGVGRPAVKACLVCSVVYIPPSCPVKPQSQFPDGKASFGLYEKQLISLGKLALTRNFYSVYLFFENAW